MKTRSITLRFILGGLCLIGLIAIRFFESQWFPEALQNFYRSTYQFSVPPNLSINHISLITSLRYFVNSALSISLICVIFPSLKTLKFVTFFYMIAFVILITIFTSLINNFAPDFYMAVFYVRRFLIQPVFLIILVPALYYQKKVLQK